MLNKIADYEPVVGPALIQELRLLAQHLKGRPMQHVNATAVGGGVAEILNRMIPRAWKVWRSCSAFSCCA